jgi:hypothetical protein
MKSLLKRNSVYRGVFLGTTVFASGIVCDLSSSKAHAVVFDVSQDPEINQHSFTFTQSGITLTVDTPTGDAVGFTTVNTRDVGLCAFLEIGTNGSRCNYGPAGTAGNPGVGKKFTGFSFSFNAPGALKSILVSQLTQVSSPSITLTAGAQSQTFTGFSLGNTLTLTNPFSLSAGQQVVVTTSGTGTAGNGSGVFRVNNFDYATVPGPAGFLGVMAAFNHSRRIRARLSSQSSQRNLFPQATT